ncbi:hypothetical protein D0C36_01330 [Mucilaginibacter conchicola]|uniref:Antitoxin component YwqK of the YwqJK toxin-antitoxin module n=1 Tax=Mucilaginibacter conchicola TaxID=2303333 RepID=A0A372NVU2_9SPHI|nr:hypothetical protein [Mucilaginibacter conchicola]RFZ94226.1 hypothetical protein D0C36_01330 [Mucilaginibacter conchicola]
MKAIITAIFLLLNINVFACSCFMQPAFKSKDDLKDNSFIALVKIKQTAPLDEKYKFMSLRTDSIIHVEVKELFKGKITDAVIDASYRSDCNMILNTGEEWLLFGYERYGKTYVSRCSYSTKYRDITGFRDWNWFRGIKELDVLRTIYNHSFNGDISNTLFYPDGKPEIKQKIVKGKLEGTRSIYYPDGKLYLTEDFKNGIRAGTRRIYDTSGHLLSLTKYRNGLKKEITRYQDTAEHAWYLNYQMRNNREPLFGDHDHDSTYFAKLLDSLRSLKHWDKEIQYHEVFSKDGRSYQREIFGYKGNVESKAYLDWNAGVYEEWHYLKSGKLEYHIKYDQRKNLKLETDYKEDGSTKDFNGICTSCKLYFDPDSPAGAAEEIYLQ